MNKTEKYNCLRTVLLKPQAPFTQKGTGSARARATWHWDLMAYGNRCRLDAKTIASHLIRELWKFDAKYHEVEQYHWINNTGLLGVEEIQAIAREIW